MASTTSMIPLNTSSASAKRLISVIFVLWAFAVSAFSIRLLSKSRLGRKWKLHDLACFISLFSFSGYCIDLTIAICIGGFGLDITEANPTNVIIGLKCFFASQFLWSASVTGFRVAIVLLYIEIFTRRSFFWTATATATLVILYYVSCVIVILTECTPISFSWDGSIAGHCVNTRDIEVFSAAFNMAVDIWVVCMPMPILWDLQMAPRRKVAISATFALGFAIAGLNVARLLQNLRCDAVNVTYCGFQSSMIVVGEMSVGVVVACVPTFGPVFFPKRLQTSSGYQGKIRSIFSSKRTPIGQLNTTIDDEGMFHTLEDDEVELRGALHIGNGAQVSRGSEHEGSETDFEPNSIVVKKDLSVVGTARV